MSALQSQHRITLDDDYDDDENDENDNCRNTFAEINECGVNIISKQTVFGIWTYFFLNCFCFIPSKSNIFDSKTQFLRLSREECLF